MFQEASPFDDLLEAPQEEVSVETDLVAACHRTRALMDRRKVLKDELKAIELDIDAEQPRLKAMMDALGVQNIKVAGVGTVYLQTNPYPKVLQPETFVAWLDEEGEGAIAKRTVNPQTLRSWTRDRMEAGHDLPPEDVLNVHLEKEVRIKAK